MYRKMSRIFNLMLVLSMLFSFAGVGAAVAAEDPGEGGGEQTVAKLPPVAISAMSGVGEHLVVPPANIVQAQLVTEGAIPLNATEEQIQAALDAYYYKISKMSRVWISPEVEARALAREAQLANPALGAQAIQPVTATVFALAIDFGATETFTIPVETGTDPDGNPICVTQTVTIEGPRQGQIPNPGPTDNFSNWYSPTLTADAKFYEKIIFGYEGAGRTRFELTDPDDGLPGINLTGYTMQDYYDNVAGEGNVYITGTVAGWVTVPHSEGYYGADVCSVGGHQGGVGYYAADMIVDAMNIFSATHSTYYHDTSADAFWPKYDADKDGFIDTFWTIHAGAGQEGGGGVEGTFALWSHSSDLRYYIADGYKIYEGDSSTEDDDIWIGPYTVQPETAETGVFAEEFGHNFFGFPDLYTTDVQNSVGDWNIMSGGAWMGWLGGTAPSGMPLWFRMIAWCGTGYCNWQEPMITRAYNDAAGDVTIGQLEKTPAGVNKGIRVNLPAFQEELPNEAGTGRGAYSGLGHGLSRYLSAAVAIPTGATGVLSFTTAWDIEENWDYGYVLINNTPAQDVDGVLENDGNPNGSQAYLNGPALTGSGAAVLSFDVSAYAGQSITLAFMYKTDPAANGDGWWVDSVMLDGVLVEDFEDAVEPGTFPGWESNGWLVVPAIKSYSNYYLIEWRSKTRYDSMMKTAYYFRDETSVEHVPYNIPGALVYYRNAKYGSTYSLRPNHGDAPSYGPKYQLLVVDMNYGPDRFVQADGAFRYFNSRISSYDAAMTLQDAASFTVSSVYGVDVVTPTVIPAKAAVTSFDDSQGYYAGFYFGAPCLAGRLCYNNSDGSAVIPAKGLYSTRITNFAGAPLYGLYGAPFAPSKLGSGNPGDDNVQHGVNFKLVSKAGDDKYNSTAVIRFGALDGPYHASVNPAEISSEVAATHFITYTMVLDNDNVGNTLPQERRFEYILDPKVNFVSSDWALGTVILPTPGTLTKTNLSWAGTLNAGEMLTFTTVVSLAVQQGDEMVITTTLRHDDYMNPISLDNLVTNVVAGEGTRVIYLPLVMRAYPATP
ncbi:MAG TPA: immune inhibitor A [Anaerolineae bacterium]|nr:immune inhibitor A [Anaerolineae bacterium]